MVKFQFEGVLKYIDQIWDMENRSVALFNRHSLKERFSVTDMTIYSSLKVLFSVDCVFFHGLNKVWHALLLLHRKTGTIT